MTYHIITNVDIIKYILVRKYFAIFINTEMNTPTITITDGGNYANIWNEIEIKVSWDPALGNNSFYKVNCTPLQSIYMHYCPSEVIEVSGRNSTTSIVVSPTPGMGFEFKIQSCVRIGNKQFNGTETNVTIVFGEFIINVIYNKIRGKCCIRYNSAIIIVTLSTCNVL